MSDDQNIDLVALSDDLLRDFHTVQTARRDAARAAGDLCAHKAYVDRLVDVGRVLAQRNTLRAAQLRGAPGDLVTEVHMTLGLIDELLAGTATRLDGTGDLGEQFQRELRFLRDQVDDTAVNCRAVSTLGGQRRDLETVPTKGCQQ